MPKKQKNANSQEDKPDLGRPEQLEIEDLPIRFQDMKSFLENYWGRVGLGLKRARQVEEVRNVLSLVKGIEWMRFFKGHASCMIHATATEVPPAELRATRRKHEVAVELEQRCWTAYHDANPKAQQAATAFQQAISQFDGMLDRFEFFFVLSCAADALKVKELTTETPKLLDIVLKAQKEKNALKETLNAQEAWFARNEVVKFAKNRRYSKSLLNFARVMAGLPEWGWFHSRRTCEALVKDDFDSQYPHKVFSLLDSVIRKTKPLNIKRVENRFRRELLGPDADPLLKGYVVPQWDYFQEAIRFCEGKGIKRSDLPFKVMDRFIYHTERGKSTMEIELAKRNELR
jgi:hypothetical protein